MQADDPTAARTKMLRAQIIHASAAAELSQAQESLVPGGRGALWLAASWLSSATHQCIELSLLLLVQRRLLGRQDALGPQNVVPLGVFVGILHGGVE